MSDVMYKVKPGGHRGGQIGKFAGMVGYPPEAVRLEFKDGHVWDYDAERVTKIVEEPKNLKGRKWFYPLQDVLKERFEQMYPQREAVLTYQIVTKVRVLEHYRMMWLGPNTDPKASEHKEVMAIMVNHGKDNGTLLVYEMKFVASN